MCTVVRTFKVMRLIDVSGVSGTGCVADGAVFSDGTTVIRWCTETPSTSTYDSFGVAEEVHGHGGATQFVFYPDPLSYDSIHSGHSPAYPAPAL